jgi:hypothetical protein
VSEALSEDRQRRLHAGGSTPAAAGASATLTVRAVFRDLEERHMQTLAAEMIARAHELANQPECECDVDVSVQSTAASGPVDEC